MFEAKQQKFLSRGLEGIGILQPAFETQDFLIKIERWEEGTQRQPLRTLFLKDIFGC